MTAPRRRRAHLALAGLETAVKVLLIDPPELYLRGAGHTRQVQPLGLAYVGAAVQDIADVRIIPGTREGEVLRERGLGDAGPWGGAYGDLVARVRLVGNDAATQPPPARPAAKNMADEKVADEKVADEPAVNPSSDHVDLDISIPEAVLGGRVTLQTPQGKVRLTIPPGTSSGARMRLKGKAAEGADLYVVLRIVVPRGLDDESRDLIEQFARLNPDDPREG